MSTKLFHGFQLAIPENGSLRHLHTHLTHLRAALIPQAETRLTAELIARAVLIVDQTIMGLREIPRQSSPLSLALRSLWDELDACHTQDRRNPAIDMTFSLTFYPLPDGRVLGLYFGEQQAFIDHWMQTPGVFEYAYWDNADRPFRLSHDEWTLRGESWAEALSPWDTPSLCGFTAVIVSDSIGPKLDQLAAHLAASPPAFSARCQAIGFHLAFRDKGITSLTEQASFLKTYRTNPEHLAFVTDRTDRARRLLPETLSYDRLTAIEPI